MTNKMNNKTATAIENKENAIMTSNERTTIIKGFIVDIETMQNHPFEIVTAYTRSNATARKLASKALNVDANFIIITELQNEPKKHVEYDAIDLMTYAINISENIEDAKDIVASSSNVSVIPYEYYEYSAQIWAIDGKGDYMTEFYGNCSPLKMTKINARGFIKMSAENALGVTVLGIHEDKRELVKKFAIVPNEDLGKCVKK